MSDDCIGSQPGESSVPGRPRSGCSFTFLEWLSVLCIAGILFSILMPNYFKARAPRQLSVCKSNLKVLATALEMYASDNEKLYPPDLQTLIAPGLYLKTLPECASKHNRIGFRRDGRVELKNWKGGPTDADYHYSVSSKPAAFSLYCRRDHSEAYAGFNADPRCYPQYHSEMGLLDHP